jgi:hypothetical protein
MKLTIELTGSPGAIKSFGAAMHRNIAAAINDSTEEHADLCSRVIANQLDDGPILPKRQYKNGIAQRRKNPTRKGPTKFKIEGSVT